MSINIQLDGKLQKISGQTMTKEKIVEKLGYTPANETTVNTSITNLESNIDADIAAVNADLSDLKAALENYIKDHPDIVEDGSGEAVFTDEAGNIIAKLDADGLHTTNIEADSFISGDDNLIINDLDGNKIFQVDKDGVETTKLKLASGDVDEQLDSLAADLAAHTGNTVMHITDAERTAWNNKSDFSGEFKDLLNSPIEEDNSGELVYTDESGNIALTIGKLDEKTTGLETVEIKLKGGKVDERINNLTADLAAVDGSKSDKGHTHEISAGASGDTEISLEGTPGTLGVSYKVSHAKPSELKADTYTKVVVNAYGHITSGETPSKIADLGITDVYTDEETDAEIAAHVDATVAHTKAQVGLGNVDNTSDIDKPISTATQAALDALKEEIVSESDSWTIADESGYIMLKAGKLDDGTVGLKTTNIIAQEVLINGNNAATENYVDVAIDALDVSDSAVNGKYVSAVSQTNGKISVTRADLPTLSKGTDTTDTLTLAHGGTFTAVTDTTVNGHTITDKTTTFTLPTETTLSKGTDTSGTATPLSHGDTFTVMTDTSVSGHTITDQNTTFTLPSETVLSKSTTTGTGNAVTDISVNGHEITLTKGKTFLEAHPDTAMLSDTTSTESPNYNGTFTVETITRDSKGHVTTINTKTIELEDAFETFRSEISESIVSESNEFIVVDSYGNKAFEVSTDGTTNTAKLTIDGDDAATKTYVDNAIAALDYSDAAVSGQYVSEVDEVDGIISVKRASLPTLSKGTDNNSAETLTHGGTFTAVVDTTVSGHQITDTTKTFTMPSETAVTADQATGTEQTPAHGGAFNVVTAVVKGDSSHNIDVTTTSIKLPAETALSKGTTSGSGNAVTDISVSGHTVTLTKGATFLTKHPDITMSTDTSSNVSPNYNGTFTVIDSVTKDTNGHVTKVNVKTVDLGDAFETFRSEISEEIVSEANEWTVTDESGNIIFQVNEDGAHTTKLELLSGDIDEQLDEIKTATHTHTVTHTPAGTNSEVSITPAGTVTSTFSGQAATHGHSFTGTATAHDHTFTGIEALISTSYTPVGSVSKPTFSGTKATISTKFTPSGIVSKPTFTGTEATISTKYTPAGTISKPTFNGTEATISTTYTPAGSVSKPTFTGSAVTSDGPSNTTTVYSITDEGALPTLTANVTNRCLKLTFGAGTLPTKGSGVSVATGEHTHNVTASGTISKPTFSGTEATISTSYTPAGTISTPTFTGTEATISTKYTPAGTISTPVFTGTEGTVSAEYTPAGTISTPTFSGTQATISMTYTPEGNIEQTTLTPAGTISSESTTPAGTVTSTFAGAETKHKHTFTGSAATLTTSAETII